MTADARLTVEAFSLSHAAILDGTTGAEETDGDLYGVSEASFEPNFDQFENQGDDVVLSIWDWMTYADVRIEGGYIPFKMIALLTGEVVTSSGVNPDDYYEIEPWTDRGMNVAPKPMLIRMPSKDVDGNVRTLDAVLYKVNFAPIGFTGPRYKDGLRINYSGRALLSANDEAGVDLGGYRSIGRLISKPSS